MAVSGDPRDSTCEGTSRAWRLRRAGLGDVHRLWLGEAVPKTEARVSDEIICTKCHVGRACLSLRAPVLADGAGDDVIMRALCSSGKGC